MSEQQRRVFTDEFKREAVGMIASSGRTLRHERSKKDPQGYNSHSQNLLGNEPRLSENEHDWPIFSSYQCVSLELSDPLISCVPMIM